MFLSANQESWQTDAFRQERESQGAFCFDARQKDLKLAAKCPLKATKEVGRETEEVINFCGVSEFDCPETKWNNLTNPF